MTRRGKPAREQSATHFVKARRNAIARGQRAERIEEMRAKPGLYVDGMTYTEPVKKVPMRQGTPEYDARIETIRVLAAEGGTDVEIGVAIGCEAGWVFTLRKRHGIDSAHAMPQRGYTAPTGSKRFDELIRLRRAKGISQQALGDALGVSSTAVGQWERVQVPLSEERIDTYGEALMQLIASRGAGMS